MGKTTVAVAMTYCGAVIGAGFATGREVVEFFTVYGRQGLGGVLLATVLFCWAGIVILDVTHQNRVYSYVDLLACILRYKPLVILADLLFLATLLAGIGVMTSAGGTILGEFGLSYQVGCGLFLGLGLAILRTGSSGFIRANSWLVPGLIAAISLLCLLQISLPASRMLPGPLVSSVLYVAFNTAMAAVALTTLKQYVNKQAVLWGGLGGGLLVGFLLLMVYGATLGLSNFPEIPMTLLAQIWFGSWDWVYKLVLFAAVFTTVLANIHGLASRVGAGGDWKVLLLVAVLGFVVAQYGFANLVGLLYPLLGACNIVLLLGLCYYSFKRFNFIKSGW